MNKFKRKRDPFFSRIFSKIVRPRITNYSQIKPIFTSKSGLEVGGPSRLFTHKGLVPVYKVISGLDGCNFSNKTLWEGNIESGKTFNYYKGKTGIQYISEATDLSQIPDNQYEFVISSNCLEHVANPFKAIEEWIRVIKKGSPILIAVPNKNYCFDHKRAYTEFSHLLNDYKANTTEHDLTHLDEILEFHDLEMDKPGGTPEQFKQRSLKNFENRALHHHVFSISVLKDIFNYFNIEVLATHEGADLIIIGRKS